MHTKSMNTKIFRVYVQKPVFLRETNELNKKNIVNK